MRREHTDTVNDAKVNLRLPHAVLDKMRWLARADDRSINAELVRAVKEFVERREREATEQTTRQAC
jgi:hypothetical protein